MVSKRLIIAALLSLGLHCVLLASMVFWTDRLSVSAEVADPSVLSVRLNGSYSTVDLDSGPASPEYQDPGNPDSGLGPSLAFSDPVAGIDFASPPAFAKENFSAGGLPELSAPVSSAPAGQIVPGFSVSQPGFDAPPSETAPSFQPAMPLSTPKPKYPILARRRGLEGIVLIELDIDNRGVPKDFRIIPPRSSPLLVKSALNSLENLLFIPATNQGRPVESVLSLKFRFELER